MTPFYDTQEFYKKMSELQERLRKSEDERMKLEERFNILSQDSRSRREACINNLRMRYIDFLEEQRLRDERNHQILGSLDKIDGSLARMTARTDRLGILRKQYEAYLLRVYANRSTGGGTGDSGVGSHNEDRSPKSNIQQTEKNLPTSHRIVTQNRGNSQSSVLQKSYPHPYAGVKDVPLFDQPRYTPGQEIPQVHIMQANGQGDGSTTVQPYHIPQYFYASQNLNIRHPSVSKAHQTPNTPQEFAPPNRNHPQQFLRSNNPLSSNFSHAYHHQLHDVSNSQYLENPRSSYPGDPSMTLSRNFPKSHEFTSSDMQTSDLQPDRANARPDVDFSANLTEEAFGPYRQSTPLPGYLDYTNRYSTGPPAVERNVGPHCGFTRSDLEKVIPRKEQILPRDYLHNPETFKSPMHASKFSSPPENNQRASDTKLSRAMNDDELDQYIHRIRRLHRPNDESLDVLDIEQNTSGDLLNATLSDDAPDQPTLRSDDKIIPNATQIISDGVKSVLALADDFVSRTENSNGEFQGKNNLSTNLEISDESGCNSKTRKEDVVAKPVLAKLNDPNLAAENADMTSDNLLTSATRDDVLSKTASIGVNQIRDTSEMPNDKLRSEVTPLVADLNESWLNGKGAATVPQNNAADPTNLLPSTRRGHEVNFTGNITVPDEQIASKDKIRTDLQRTIHPMTKGHDSVPKEMEMHRDIEGDKVNLIERDEIPEQGIDFVRELQPPSLQHYEKNVVEIRVGNDDKNSTVNPNVEHEDSSKCAIQDIENNVAESTSQESIADKVLSVSKEKINGDLQHQDTAESKYQPNLNDEHPVTYEHHPRQNLIHGIDGNGGGSHRSEQNSNTEYDIRQTDDESNHLVQRYNPTSDEPYGPHEIYHANQHYETDPNQVYAQKPNPEFAYGPDQQFEDDSNAQYAPGSDEQYTTDTNEGYVAGLNEQYAAHPNQQYTSDSTEQYAVDPNQQYTADAEQYAGDPSEQYAVDPNEQYAIDSTAEYPADLDEHYVTDPNGRYPPDSNEHYAIDPNEHYVADPNGRYPPDSNEHYATHPTEQYEANPNAQYGYYADQPYQNDPGVPYSNSGNEQYDYDADQGYQDDPNQQFEHDPNQQYAHDPEQQYAHDPNQQYQLDPNQQYELDPNQHYERDTNEQYEHAPNDQYEVDPGQHDPNEFSAQDYAEHEYGQDNNYELGGYGKPEVDDSQQLENNSEQEYDGRNLELASSNQDYLKAAAEEQNETRVTAGDSHIEDLSNPNVIAGAEEYSTKEKTKNKDVIKALLESDTESTIERNPSNNTESDFDFN